MSVPLTLLPGFSRLVHVFSPDDIFKGSVSVCLSLTPLPGVCCSIIPLTLLPGLSNIHDPVATIRDLCVYVYALYVYACARDPTSGLSVCVCLAPMLLPGIRGAMFTLLWSKLNVCFYSMGEWPR